MLSNNTLALLSFTAMLFTWSCQCKNLSILTQRYFTEFDGYSLFPVSLILISSDSTFLGDLKITSLVFSTLSEILFGLNQLFICFISLLTSLFRFFTDLWKRWKIRMKEICIMRKVMYFAVLNCFMKIINLN